MFYLFLLQFKLKLSWSVVFFFVILYQVLVLVLHFLCINNFMDSGSTI